MRLMRLGIIAILLSILVAVFTGCQQEFSPGAYIDDMGREVSIDKAPQRIVSHVPAITETLFALGLGDRVVGVSDFCDYPEEAKSKPSVGAYFNPAIEAIVALEPDLVLTDGHSESIKQLDTLGIKYLAIDPQDFDGILRDIELLGKVAGVEGRARKLIDDLRDDISNVISQVEGVPRVRVFFVLDATDLNNPWTAGPGTFVDSLVTMAGGENIAANAPAPWVQLSIEQVVSSDPEIIILPAKHGTAFTPPEVLGEHPIWREITAVKQGRIFTIDDDLVSRYGPRIVQGLEEMAKMIHPELLQ